MVKTGQFTTTCKCDSVRALQKNSSGDEIANVNR